MDWNYAEDEAYADLTRLNKSSIKFKKSKKTSIKKVEKDTNKIVYWELANWEKIDIDTMTIEHLKNTLKLIVRNNLLIDKR